MLPKDILEALMYGGDFDEPTDEFMEGIEDLINANSNRVDPLPIDLTEVVYDSCLKASYEESQYYAGWGREHLD